MDLSNVTWRKASHSGGNCVEISSGAARVAVRDSKDPTGPRLTFSPAACRLFAAVASA